MFLALGRKRVAAPLSIMVVLIGWATALEYLSGIVRGIDDLFLFGREWGRVGVIVPGRMGPPATVSWSLVGAALLCCLGSSRYRRIVPMLGGLVAAISGLSLLGYFYGADPLYTIPRLTVIAFQTATMLFAVGCGLMASAPEHEPLKTLLDKGAPGTLARRTLPFLISLPAIVGFLLVRGEEQHLYDTATGTALLVLVLTAMLCVVLWWGVQAVAAHEQRHAAHAIERQQAASALRLSEERLRRALSAARMVAWEWNAIENRIVATDNAAEVYGLAPDTTIANSQNGFLLVHPDDVAQHRALVERAVAERGGYVSQFRIIRPSDQRVVWLEERAQARSDDDDNALRIGGVVRDITEQKVAEEALRASDSQKDQFLAILAHELRNPLAPIRNAAQILKLKGSRGPDDTRPLAIIERQIEHMTRLIDDLLDVSRVSQGKLELRLKRIEFSEVALAAVEACRDEVEARGQVLHFNLPREPSPLNADRDRLVQVFCNLISNASKYTPTQGLIEFTALVDGQLVATVKDNGQGIPRDKLSEIFDLFAQVDRSLGRQGGLGIGLTLARDLVELHGGSIEAHSEGLGRGSAFTVRLPITTAPPTAAPTVVEAPLIAPAPQRVLIADDNRDGAESLATLLLLAGHDVRVAFDGAAALAEAKAFQPTVALLDIGMPKLNGYDLARRIRQESWGNAVHLVALTGWGQDSDRAQAISAGFDDHLVKPVAPEFITAMLVRIGAASALTDTAGPKLS